MIPIPLPSAIVPEREPAGPAELQDLWLRLRDAIDAHRADPCRETGRALTMAYGAHQAALPAIPRGLRRAG